MHSQLTFGVFPGSVSGTETGLAAGAEDDAQRIQEALDALQSGDKQLLIRCYAPYTGAVSDETLYAGSPINFEQYARNGRKLDLVLPFRHAEQDLRGWLQFVRGAVRRYGAALAKLQITEEPNFTGAPASADGGFPNVLQALVQGVIAAKDEARSSGYAIQIGFNVVAGPRTQEEFWKRLGEFGRQPFLDALDYVGLDSYPDVFFPVATADLPNVLIKTLDIARTVHLAAANIPPSIPLHIAESGWATGPNRSYERQAEVIETIVRTIYEQRDAFRVTHYELFMLRDVDSRNPEPFFQFGILRDDYTPKPAFERYRRLIAEFGARV